MITAKNILEAAAVFKPDLGVETVTTGQLINGTSVGTVNALLIQICLAQSRVRVIG